MYPPSPGLDDLNLVGYITKVKTDCLTPSLVLSQFLFNTGHTSTGPSLPQRMLLASSS